MLFRDRQSAFNQASRDHWEAFQQHRDRISSLLGVGGPVGLPTRLCVLGAGNTNDLNLPGLLAVHREVHLVDLDAEALALGAVRQGVAEHPGLTLHGGVDLTGMLETIATWGPLTPIHLPDIQALVDWPTARVAPVLPGPFDRVASTCLLSQLIANARHSIGESHSEFLGTVQAIRLGHLRLLLELTASSGEAWLVTDATSTDLVPGLASWEAPSLPDRLVELARAGKLFHGADPSKICSLFQKDPRLSTLLESVEIVPPWLWRLHERDYLVWALRASRKRALGLSDRGGFH